MPDLGSKHECTGCGAKFYDLGKDEPICPKCGLNQLTEEEEPVAEPEAEAPAEDEAAAADEPDEAEDEIPDEDEEGDDFDAGEDE